LENATETHKMIKTTVEYDSLSRSKTFYWFKRFKNGQQSTEGDPRSGGRLSTSNNDDVVANIGEKSVKRP